MEPIGFIGLGTIGGVIVGNIKNSGYRVVVHDIRSEAVQALVNGGAAVARSPAEVARRCRVIFTSLPGPPEVEKVALGSDGIREAVHDGSIYIDLSSSSPELIRHIGRDFHTRGAHVIDAPLIVGANGVAQRNLQVMASGDYEIFQRTKALLESFADTIVYTGELGTGTIIKLAHNLVRRGIGLAIGEGLVLGTKAGADPQILWNCMHWGLAVQLAQLANTLPSTAFAGKYEEPASFGIGLARKDVGLATELGRQQKVPMPIAALVEQTMVEATNRGWSNQSTISLLRLQEEAAGVEIRKRQ